MTAVSRKVIKSLKAENLNVIREENKIYLPDQREKEKSHKWKSPKEEENPKRLWGAACNKYPEIARSSLFEIPIEKKSKKSPKS